MNRDEKIFLVVALLVFAVMLVGLKPWKKVSKPVTVRPDYVVTNTVNVGQWDTNTTTDATIHPMAYMEALATIMKSMGCSNIGVRLEYNNYRYILDARPMIVETNEDGSVKSMRSPGAWE